MSFLSSISKKVNHVVHKVEKKVEHVEKKVEHAATKATNEVKKTVQHAEKKVEKAVKQAAHDTVEISKKAQNLAHKAEKKVEHAVAHATKEVKKTVHHAEKKVEKAVKHVAHDTVEISKKAQNLAHQVEKKVEHEVAHAAKKVEHAVKHVAHDTAEISKKAEKLAHQVGQVGKEFIKGAGEAALSDVTFDILKNNSTSKHPIAHKSGEVFGHAVSTIAGTVETIGSAALGSGGLVLDASGVGAIVGVPATAVGVAGVTHGSATAIKGASSTGQSAKDLYNLVIHKGEKPSTSSKGTGEVRNFTKEELNTKPKNSPDPEKWQKKGGSIKIDEKGTWTYKNKEGNSVTYTDGFPDFKTAGYVKQEIDIGRFKDYNTDFKKADELAPNGPRDAKSNTWHHHQDGKTMQEVNKEIHKDFTHRGGMALKKRK